jgi:hypothetical protein
LLEARRGGRAERAPQERPEHRSDRIPQERVVCPRVRAKASSSRSADVCRALASRHPRLAGRVPSSSVGFRGTADLWGGGLRGVYASALWSLRRLAPSVGFRAAMRLRATQRDLPRHLLIARNEGVPGSSPRVGLAPLLALGHPRGLIVRFARRFAVRPHRERGVAPRRRRRRSPVARASRSRAGVRVRRSRHWTA